MASGKNLKPIIRGKFSRSPICDDSIAKPRLKMLKVLEKVCAEIEDETLWKNIITHPDTKDPYRLASLLVINMVPPQKKPVLFIIKQLAIEEVQKETGIMPQKRNSNE